MSHSREKQDSEEKHAWLCHTQEKSKTRKNSMFDYALSLVVKLYVGMFCIKLDYQSKGIIHTHAASTHLAGINHF